MNLKFSQGFSDGEQLIREVTTFFLNFYIGVYV